MLDRFEILASRIRRLTNRDRWSTRILGHHPPGDQAEEPGLLLIQIDGLGESYLRRAIDTGVMPFLGQLQERDGYRIHPLYSGIPSSTPAFQAELYYGVPTAVPGFGFLDPDSGTVRSMNEPGSAIAVEEALQKEREGLLTGGSSWGNVFGGGAQEAHLGASTSGFASALAAVAPNRILRVILWHGWNVLRVIANLFVVTGLVFWDLLRGSLRPVEVVRELRFVPVRVMVSAVMREIITAGASVDAERGVPIIHVNFLGYDEHAHRRGPDSRFTRWSLRGIDSAVKRLCHAVYRSEHRDYQIWIFSDHGQEKVEGFRERRGIPIEEAVCRAYSDCRPESGDGENGGGGGSGMNGTAAIDRSAITAWRYRWLGFRLPRWATGGAGHDPDLRGSREAGPLLLHQGPLGFLYLPPGNTPAQLEDLARRLVEEEGVPGVLVPLPEGEARGYRRGQSYSLPADAETFLGADHPRPQMAARDLLALIHHRGAGALTLLGWDPENPLSLQSERGSHGGPGSSETSAFLMLPPEAQALVRSESELRPSAMRRMARRALRRSTDGVEVAETDRRSQEKEESITLRLMTYNVHGCRGMDGVFAPQRIARVIAREEPDVVCLQEIDQRRARSGRVDQVDLIAKRLEVDYQFHGVAEVDDGRFGNAVLSVYPLKVRKAGALPSAERAKSVFSLEDRGALWVTLEIAGETVHIVNTHLSILEHERRLQTRGLLGPDWLESPESEGPVILAGDFNASPDSSTIQRLQKRFRNVVAPGENDRALRTWSGRAPLRRIDHVLVSEVVGVRRVWVPRTRLSRVASDHLPLVVDLLVPRLTVARPREQERAGASS